MQRIFLEYPLVTIPCFKIFISEQIFRKTNGRVLRGTYYRCSDGQTDVWTCMNSHDFLIWGFKKIFILHVYSLKTKPISYKNCHFGSFHENTYENIIQKTSESHFLVNLALFIVDCANQYFSNISGSVSF